MNNKFYQPGSGRAAKVDDLFAIIAPNYDLINDLQSFGLHRLWKSTLVRMAAPKAGERALDVCCGTGDIALALHRQGAEVIGLDFSPAMLQIAQCRATKAQSACNRSSHPIAPHDNLHPITCAAAHPPGPPAAAVMPASLQFIRGDALELPFPDNSFDVVAAGYGLRNLASWEKGLEQMWRVSRPGARLLVLDFGKPDNRFWRRIYNAYLQFLVPLFGKVFCKDPATHAYIYASLQDYPAQRGVARKMEALGCRAIAIRNLAGGAMSINFAIKA
jgi:demethylmenaquinone methyltransferase/2-methoxy-6-polyprenyl-1,4-benzoquinol methylase